MTTLSKIHSLLPALTARKNFTGNGTLRYDPVYGLECFGFSPCDFIIDPPQWGFSGISTFAHLKYVKCLSERDSPLSVDVQNATHHYSMN